MVLQRVIAETFLCLFLLVMLSNSPVKAEKTILADELYDKMRGMWLGQLIGNYAGRATEGRYSGLSPNPDSAVPWVIKQEWDGDDDTDIEYVALHILETSGLNCHPQEIVEQWFTHIGSSGIYIANKQAWHLIGDGYLPPETGSRTYNEHWYSIDSQIETEILGAISPGCVQSAIDLTGMFAGFTNTGFPVHAAQFYCAMYSTAFFEPNVVDLVVEGLTVTPTTSRTYQVITDVLSWYLDDSRDGHLDWRVTRRKLYDNYQGNNSFGRYYNWVESTINTGATVLAILYGQGDFKNTVQIGVLAGWDSDCNPATAGGLIGIIKGFSNLPPDLTDPNICGDVYKNVHRPYLPNPEQSIPQYDTITNIATRLTDLAEQNILRNGGYIAGSGSTKTYHIADFSEISSEPEKPDPNGPVGLVAEALVAGITVIPTAAVQRYDVRYDRHKLDSIVDGITDNSYNGHKAYYSRQSDVREQDWYQLNFSEPVEFETLTFWEGDIIWNRINTYYRDDDPEGGFFEDLIVEIIRDGEPVVPHNLKTSPELDRFLMYQKITFTFAPTVGDAIRIQGTPGGTLGYTTIMELEVGGSLDPNLYIINVEIEGGHVQRSTVSEITMTFSDNVVITPDDIQIHKVANNTLLESWQIRLMYDVPTHRLTMRFDTNDDGLYGDSLPDDLYRLRLNYNSIVCPGGHQFSDTDSIPGDGFYTILFHTLFGDIDGSAFVDFTDLLLLASYWLDAPAKTGLDANADNIVNFVDFAELARNWFDIMGQK
ncbi:MAG: ADP-ribosylglycohydrolase family protein [Desulfobacteraceae bacterium]|nr:ADP-ribosylglycohydrolase family protein [Desulfobacteraceae bacterium]